MNKIRLAAIPGFESVHRFEDERLGLIAFIARHSSLLGTPLGGCRIRDDYTSEADALSDVLRLAEGMTHKAAIHDLSLGGGKMVVWSLKPLAGMDRKALFQFVGQAVQNLEGQYITAEDMNTSVADLEAVRRVTTHVAGIDSGDPSEFTAMGVWETLCYLADAYLGRGIDRCRLAIQGAGKVGRFLVKTAAGFPVEEIVVSDILPERARELADEFGCRVTGAAEIFDEPCDLFVPCGVGGILESRTIDRLKCLAVAGAANNQFDMVSRDEPLLRYRGILYAPDVVANGGGLINVACERPSYDRRRAERLVRRIPQTLESVFTRAEMKDITATEAVHQLTAERLLKAGRVKRRTNEVRV